MKRILLIILISLIIVGCESAAGRPCFVKEIPEHKKEVAAKHYSSLGYEIVWDRNKWKEDR